MRYKLEQLESLIFEGLSSRDKDLSLLEKEIPEIYNRFKKDIHQEIFNLGSVGEANLFIQNHFNSLIYLWNMIVNKRNYNELTDYKIKRYIELKITFLIIRYYKYLDKETIVPKHWQRYINRLYRIKFTVIILNLYKVDVNEQLIDILREQYNVIVCDKTSFQNLEFFELIFNRLHDSFISEDEIIKHLYFLNFNSKEFIQFLINKIDRETSKRHNKEAKLEHLISNRKYFSLIPSSSTLFYSKNNPSISEKLFRWIDSEINLVKSNPDISSNNNMKLETSFTVEQLSILHRLLHDNKVINPQNQKEIFDFISKNFKTKKTDRISKVSIQSKYYSSNPSTKDFIKKILLDMIKTVQSY